MGFILCVWFFFYRPVAWQPRCYNDSPSGSPRARTTCTRPIPGSLIYTPIRPKSKRSLVSGPVLTVAVVDDPHGTHRIQVGPQAVRTCARLHLSLAKEVQDSETRGSRDRVVTCRLSRRRSNPPVSNTNEPNPTPGMITASPHRAVPREEVNDLASEHRSLSQ
jgi:hypothetical protein